MSSSSLPDFKTQYIQSALNRLLAADISGASDYELLLHGAVYKSMAAVSAAASDPMAELYANDISRLYVGVAYNTVTDEFIRLGASAGVAVGELMDLSLSPVFSRLRRVALSDAGVVYGGKGISWTNKTTYEDGSAVSLDGTQGQIMVEYLPTYIKTGKWGEWNYLMLSHLPLTGFVLDPVFNGYDAVYRGAYEASLYDGKLCSVAKSPVDGVSDIYPVTTRSGAWGYSSLTTVATDSLAAARGDGWMQDDLLMTVWERKLMLVAYASYDIPGIVGAGRINLSGGAWEDGSYIGKCGLGDAASGYASAVQNGGSAGYATDYSQVLGIENPWGNVWKRVSSLVSNGELYYQTAVPTPTIYNSTSGWTRMQDADGTDVRLPINAGYAGTPHSGDAIVFPKDTTGSSSAKMHDYYYYASGLRVLRVGGFAGAGASAGPFSWAARDAASGAGADVGGRLCFKKASAA